MANGGSHEHAGVTLVRSNLAGNVVSEITVALEITGGAITPRSSLQSPIELLRADAMREYKTDGELRLAAEVAVSIGVAHYRQRSNKDISFILTRLNGKNLLDDCTVGFCLAGFICVRNALGDLSQKPTDMSGWQIVESLS